jgi:dihydroneopterin aldolase
MFSVFVRDIDLYAYHGVSEAERSVGQRYRLDLELSIAAPIPTLDDLEETVDYGVVTAVAIHEATASKSKLMETVAQRICNAVLAVDKRIESVTVRLSKRCPPVPHVVCDAGVILSLSRR